MPSLFRFFPCPLAILAAALAGGCSSGGSSPFSSASNTDLTFVSAAQTWDLNKDNSVSCEEWKRYAAEMFQAGDANADGFVAPEEYGRITKQDRLFETVGLRHFDANGDGKLTLAEMSEKPNPAFGMLDKNKDCQLDSYEMVQTRAPPPKAKDTYGEAPDARMPN